MKRILFLVFIMGISVFSFAQWVRQSPLPTNDELTSVVFANENTGYAIGMGRKIIKTIDGGTSWSVMPCAASFCGMGTLNSLYLFNADTLYVVQNWCAILKTTDGGLSWTQYNIPVNS